MQAYELGLSWRLLGPDRDEILLYVLYIAQKMGHNLVERRKLSRILYGLRTRTKFPVKYRFGKSADPESSDVNLDLLDLFVCGFTREHLDLKGPIYELTSFGKSYVESYVSPRLSVFEQSVADEVANMAWECSK